MGNQQTGSRREPSEADDGKPCKANFCVNYGGCKNLESNGDCVGAYFTENNKIFDCCKSTVETFSNIENNNKYLYFFIFIILLFVIKRNLL